VSKQDAKDKNIYKKKIALSKGRFLFGENRKYFFCVVYFSERIIIYFFMYRTIIFSFLFLFSSLLFFVPSPLFADEPELSGFIPCGRTTGTPAEMAPCTLCHIIVGGQRIISWGMGVMTVIAIVVIVAMGILYIVSTGNEQMMSTAKSGIKATLIGFAVMLSAWLIVMTVLRVISVKQDDATHEYIIPKLTISPSGFSFTCDTNSTTPN